MPVAITSTVTVQVDIAATPPVLLTTLVPGTAVTTGVVKKLQSLAALEGPATSIPVGRLSVNVRNREKDGLRELSMANVRVLRPPRATVLGEKLLENPMRVVTTIRSSLGRAAVARARGQVSRRIHMGAHGAAGHVDADGAGAESAEGAVAEGDGHAAVHGGEHGEGAVRRGVSGRGDVYARRQSIRKRQHLRWCRRPIGDGEGERAHAARTDGVWNEGLRKQKRHRLTPDSGRPQEQATDDQQKNEVQTLPRTS